MLHQRKNKLIRAKQLGFVDPKNKYAHEIYEEINLLFVCSRNQWRSPTAEKIYKNKPNLNCRSAGTAHSARHKLSAIDIKWSDIIFVMENKHRAKIRADYPGESKYKEIIVMGIEDNYQYMDKELIDEIISVVDPILYGERKQIVKNN